MPMNLAALDNLDVKATARAIALARVALGSSYLVAAGPALKLWPGRGGSTDEDRAMNRMLARSLGGRDLALAIGTLLALSHDTPVRGWVEAAMLADVADAVATAMAFRRLPRGRAAIVFVGSLGVALVERRLASSLG